MTDEVREERLVYFLNDVFKMYSKTPEGALREERYKKLLRKYHLTRRRRKKQE